MALHRAPIVIGAFITSSSATPGVFRVNVSDDAAVALAPARLVFADVGQSPRKKTCATDITTLDLVRGGTGSRGEFGLVRERTRELLFRAESLRAAPRSSVRRCFSVTKDDDSRRPQGSRFFESPPLSRLEGPLQLPTWQKFLHRAYPHECGETSFDDGPCLGLLATQRHRDRGESPTTTSGQVP